MPDSPDFDAIARTILDRTDGYDATVEPFAIAQLRHTARLVAVALSPWTQHHPRCARVTEADVCDCGLNAELQKYLS